jgi:hypothetical protein
MRWSVTIIALCLFTGLPSHSQSEESLLNHMHVHVLARQLGLYDWGIIGDGAASQTLLVQLSDASRQEKSSFQKLAIINYEFFPPGDSGLPEGTNDYKLIWEFYGIRTVSCDQTAKQLHYGDVVKAPDSKARMNILRVKDSCLSHREPKFLDIWSVPESSGRRPLLNAPGKSWTKPDETGKPRTGGTFSAGGPHVAFRCGL